MSSSLSSLIPGDPFHPKHYMDSGHFRGMFIPDCITCSTELSPAAKLVYGHLFRRAMKEGYSFPSLADIAHFVGLKPRRVREILRELETQGLLRSTPQYWQGQQTTNQYEFLWQEQFLRATNSRKKRTPRPRDARQERASIGRQDSAWVGQQEPADVRNHFEEMMEDPPSADNPARFDTPHQTKPGSISASDILRVQQEVSAYVRGDLTVTEFQARRMLQAAGEHGAEGIVTLLSQKQRERQGRYGPDGKHGPQTAEWFVQVVENFFAPKKRRSPRTEGLNWSSESLEFPQLPS